MSWVSKENLDSRLIESRPSHNIYPGIEVDNGQAVDVGTKSTSH
jgi:hypothetical protein